MAQAAEPPKPLPVVAGTVVTVKDATGRPWCATVATLGRGVDAESWAWLSYNAEPRRIDHVPLGELKPGCLVQPARQEPARRVVEPIPVDLPPTGAVR